jgi:hypothetical protein
MDFTKIKPELASEIIRSAESCLSSQVDLATSADQRAAVMASVFAAAGAALVAGTITVAGGDVAAPIVAGGIVSGALFLAGAALCVKATMPVEFYIPGGKPFEWRKDCEAGRDLKDCLADLADHLQERIEFNKGVIIRNAWWFKWGAWLGITAPFAGAAVWGLMTLGRYLA